MINEIQLIEEFEKTTFTDQNQKKQYGDLLNYLIDSVPKVEKCGDCSRRKFYQQGYNDGLSANKWIPFEERETDAEEKEMYRCDMMLTGKLPDEDEEILVTYASGYVGSDVFLREGCECYLDSGAAFVTEAVAWMSLPDPYKEEAKEALRKKVE